jgi:hypothetical protein
VAPKPGYSSRRRRSLRLGYGSNKLTWDQMFALYGVKEKRIFNGAISGCKVFMEADENTAINNLN